MHMPGTLLRYFFFSLLLATSTLATSQTILYGGDVVILGIQSDMGGCGLPPASDEISFMSFKDITTGTTIDITDNGYGHTQPGFWGDGEGTLRLTRTGGTIPKGTVITMQGQNLPTGFQYRIISPDVGWTFTNLNIPGGDFNVNTGAAGVGGDQVYIMQGGQWNNQGGGTNKATYSGRVIWGANTNALWSGDGTETGSDLHPDVIPCYHSQQGIGAWHVNGVKYMGPLEGDYYDGDSYETLDHEGFFYTLGDPSNWWGMLPCNEYLNTGPNYALGYTVDLVMNMSMAAVPTATGCAPYEQLFQITLPDAGEYNIVYFIGSDTFELLGITNPYPLYVTINQTSEYGLISVERVGGCVMHSPLSGGGTVTTFGDVWPGIYTEIWVCDNYPIPLDLDLVIQGNPDPGGVWLGPGFNLFQGLWIDDYGPGLYTYALSHGHGSPCTPPYDSASVRIHTIDPDESIFEISCDQNGTPNDISDDLMIVTITMIADGFGPDYSITINEGTITPNIGTAGEPNVFVIGPAGSALGEEDLILEIWNLHPEHIPPSTCIWHFPVTPPGFCSDPCDYDMEANISGGGQDVCVGNCPDDPVVLEVETIGGTPPYKMDFSVSAPTFPTWNFNNIFISDLSEIEICVANVPAPTFNAGSGILTLPNTLGGHEVAITLENVYDKYDCTAQLFPDIVYLTIHELPKLDTFSLEFCSAVAEDVDLTVYDIDVNPFLDITWYDGNPFTVGDKIEHPANVDLTNIGELWAWAMDDFCANAVRINFKILPSPEIEPIAPIEVCTGGVVVLQSLQIEDPAMSMAVYTFHSGHPLDATTLLDPTYYQPGDSTTIYLLATAGMCLDTVAIQINVQDYPNFTLQATPCDLLNNTYSIVFSTTADSIHASTGTVVNNPSGSDQVTGIPDGASVTIELLNPSTLCKDTVLITAPNCNCPFIAQPLAAQPSYEICEGTSIPVLTVSVGAGLAANWYTVPSGGVAFLQNSLTYQPPTPTSATYYVEAFDNANACYSIRTEIPFIVNPVADLQSVADQVLCEDETINLTALTPGVLNGVNGNGGWFDLSNNQPVSGTISPQNGDSWYYQFSSNPGNCKTFDTIAATVNPLPTIDLYEVTCDENTLTYDLFFTSNATDITASGGSLGQISGTDSFSLTSIPFDLDIQFTLDNSATGCNNSVLQAAPDCSCPALLQETNYEACSDEGNIDLTTFEGFGVSGNWQLVSTPAGSNPATLAGSNVQIQNKDAGLYTLRFIRSVILANCVDTADFTLRVHASPFVDAGVDGTSCAPDDIVLTGTGGGSNVQFNWQTTGTNLITNPNALNTSYALTTADITAGSVSFTLTASDQTGFCPDAEETIDITIDASAYFVLDNTTQNYCDTADTEVDLDDFITFGTTGGHWFFPAGVPGSITNNSLFTPSSLTAGNYTVYYTTTNAVPPCENDTLGVTLIIENCSCPSVALSNPTDRLCSESGTQDLDDYLITTEPGTWSIVGEPSGNNPAVISGSDFITNGSDAGTYTLRFTLNNPVAGCDDFAEIDFEVVESPTAQITSADCADDLLSWEAIILTSAENVVNTLGTLTSLGNDRYLVENIPLDTDLQITVTNGNGLCSANINVPSPDCECTLNIANLPDDISLCPGESIVLEAEVSGGKGTVTEFWVVQNDSLFQNTLEVDKAGTYQFVSFDDLGCREEHNVDVTIYEEMVADVTLQHITCPGDKDGVIMLHGIAGGNGPFFISVNGATAQPINAFPLELNNLNAGNYQIEISDAFNCSIEFSVSIQSASSETVNLGPDQTILVGDSLLINPVLTFTPASFYWEGDIDILDENALDNWVSPDADKTVSLFAIDDKGCLYTDELHIRVLLTSSIYVPNIFSPNGDGVNDLLAPSTDPSITGMEYFEIYSRWGELIFSATNFIPNQSNFGWDGTLRQKPAIPGVYVYRLKAVNKRGQEFILYGDLTLIR